MRHESYPDARIREILNSARTIAIVGASPKSVRPSYFVMKYLIEKGYQVIPVNPGQDGKDILGQRVYASLSDVPRRIDMVDIFRASDQVPRIVDEALCLDPLPAVIWMQLGIRNDVAAEKAEAAGIDVIMNRCPKIEYGRLSGEIAWTGVNTRTLSSKRASLKGSGFQHLTIGRSGKPSRDD